MPRYFMHICNGNGFSEDSEGVELADETVARAEAARAARDVMAADIRDGYIDLTSFIEVEDAEHRLLFTLTFADAVDIQRSHTGEAGAMEQRRKRREH
jgi:hypothetical protein